MQALEALQVPLSSVNLEAQSEDVREKVLDAGQSGMAYTGRPRCDSQGRLWKDAGYDASQPSKHRYELPKGDL